MKIGIANDHRGIETKQKLTEYLTNKGYDVVNYGTNTEGRVDYTTYGFIIGEKVASHEVDYGIAICGSAIGISIACNKVKGIRCAKVSNKEEAHVTRIDNNSNIVAFSEKLSEIEALEVVKTFIETEASLEEKHTRRVNKIITYEENN